MSKYGPEKNSVFGHFSYSEVMNGITLKIEILCYATFRRMFVTLVILKNSYQQQCDISGRVLMLRIPERRLTMVEGALGSVNDDVTKWKMFKNF